MVKNTRIMFLRAPKHFKVGKQFISQNFSVCTKQITLKNIQVTPLGLISYKKLFNLCYLFNKNVLPELHLTRITCIFLLRITVKWLVFYL